MCRADDPHGAGAELGVLKSTRLGAAERIQNF